MLDFLRKILFLAGFGCVAFYGNSYLSERVSQSYENWAFEQHIGGNADTSLPTYLRERTPLSFLVKDNAPVIPLILKDPTSSPAPTPQQQQKAITLASGDILGRVAIERLNLSAIVREGVDTQVLRSAVGHVPSTALPGQVGNFAIAAHRDTLFRALKDIKQGDLVTFESPNHGIYSYKVLTTRIVKPSDIAVLRPDGGSLLTMITCYPFYYVGSAPKRFIVQARLVPSAPYKT